MVDPSAGPGRGQDAAVARAGRTRLLLLAGGPGTGKTTTLKRLVGQWNRERPGTRTVVAAPTGRAAARARQAFADAEGTPGCLTLHRLLGLRPGLGEPWHGPHRPLPFDLVIVDEASMVDLRTAVALVEALGPQASLVLVGDPGQLPSVDAGAVLADLLARPEFAPATVRLSERFRLRQECRTLAQVFDLLEGPVDDPQAVVAAWRALGNGSAPDFRWIETEGDPGPVALAAWGSARGFGPGDLSRRILLSPVHQGPGGTEALGALADRSLGRAPGTVAEGLPWMIRRNLPHLDLHNGDRGLVVRREGRLVFVTAEEPDKARPFGLVSEDGQGAWAVSVHKSQGSEFDRVVLVLPPGDSPTLVRELLYTGLTRAKKEAVLVGSAASLARVLGRSADRVTGLGV
jgi:exodeoxyribonuclease V alpha subunit